MKSNYDRIYIDPIFRRSSHRDFYFRELRNPLIHRIRVNAFTDARIFLTFHSPSQSKIINVIIVNTCNTIKRDSDLINSAFISFG